MQTTIIQTTSSWELDLSIDRKPFGYHLVISSLVPTARRPEHQVKFSGTFNSDELRRLRDAIDQSLKVAT